MNTYIWLAIMIVSIIIEVSTAGLVAVWFAPAALISMILAIFNVHTVIQIGVFIAISAILMLVFYKKVKESIDTNSEKTNIDAIVGKEGICEEDIGEMTPGRVKVGGMSWSAYIEKGGEPIKKGEYVTVLAIDSVKLKCEKSINQPKIINN